MSKSKYVWENDEIHRGYEYNNINTWKGRQIDYLFDFIENEFSFTSSGTKVLDIGCNAALNLKSFKEKYYNENNEYYGFDLNDTALNFAIKNVPEGKFKKCNFLIENPINNFDNDFFDICFSTWVLSHINLSNEREALIQDMIRTSKRGIIYEAYRDTPGERYMIGTPSEFNVVVFDDYSSYSKVVKLHSIKHEDTESGLFYWNKTK
tara:strand:- start:24 stop:644 length:621 start_codon:yes stop_codon:yes gene_type:complete